MNNKKVYDFLNNNRVGHGYSFECKGVIVMSSHLYRALKIKDTENRIYIPLVEAKALITRHVRN